MNVTSQSCSSSGVVVDLAYTVPRTTLKIVLLILSFSPSPSLATDGQTDRMMAAVA